ncbi:MAG: glycosyltransferase family 1 protein [Candidatus Omnitrophica bacterium]|nr:glycosyltransferase family 1 protein [Candidatus Omnitrophota bacterium]MDD5670861.1 glycosyltransferase family 1 protein [Candidatus Omnitrophota bacterium]
MKKHAIGLDIRMLQNTGIGTYLRGLLKGLRETGAAHRLDLSLFGRPEHAAEMARMLPEQVFHPFPSRIYSIREQWDYLSRLKKCRIWHAPHYNIPLLKGRTRLVVTVHDLIHWIFRHDMPSHKAFYAEYMFKRVIRSADQIIAVSNSTKDDLIMHFKADPKRISVIYEGVDERFRELEPAGLAGPVLRKFGIVGNYFLYVGMLKPHKQVERLLRLYRGLKAEHRIESALVIVGKKDKRYPPGYEDLAGLQSGGGIFHIPSVSGDELLALYNGAMALVHLSRYEGFGLTVLEAMACGTPVIAADAASIPEVAGDGAYLVSPDDDDDIMDAMVRMEEDGGLREELRKQGKNQAARFRWDDMAVRTAEIYERVLERL